MRNEHAGNPASSAASRLAPSCRVALAALLHDLGKFAERAGIEVENLEGNAMLYCPTGPHGRHSHRHAAWTALAIDAIGKWIPVARHTGTGAEANAADVAPFRSWNDRHAVADGQGDDSLINGAAKHHRPDTPLQRIIAVADRLASGFERSDFEAYNGADEGRDEGSSASGGTAGRTSHVNHLRARQWPLLETVQLLDGGSPGAGSRGNKAGDGVPWRIPQHRIPLRAMAPETLFPQLVARMQPADDATARREYRQLWEAFVRGVQQIPEAHRQTLPLWLDHFDSLLLTFSHAIPSATATRNPGPKGGFLSIPADVSLYDHSKAVAALAVALWQYHAAHDSVQACFADAASMRTYDEHAEPEFLLVQGDFFGIQEFIFAVGGETDARKAKLLRGRSFMVALLGDLAAMLVLEAFGLPSTSQIINAAGKFMIVAPNLPDAGERLEQVRQQLDQWFLEHTFGQSGIGLAATPARRQDFTASVRGGRFRALIDRLFQAQNRRKLRRFDLCRAGAPEPLFTGVHYPSGACRYCGKAPATATSGCRLCEAQIMIGDRVVKRDLLSVHSLRPGTPRAGGSGMNELPVTLFGYGIEFGIASDRMTQALTREQHPPVRVWDFSLPQEDGSAPLWQGYARRSINGYVSKQEGEIEEFESIAATSVREEDGKRRGIAALGILKGDVDNLGRLFKEGMTVPTFARMASMSRQVNAFFSVWLPWVCARKFPHTYTVFAGGDDFFLIGPWLQQIRLAQRMREDFGRYVANDAIHFSAGLAVAKPGMPVRALADLSEEALDHAKKHVDAGSKQQKNAVTCWQQTVSWDRFQKLLEAEGELQALVEEMREQYGVEVSTGYLYGLLHLCDKADSARAKAEDNIWRSWFVYRTWRFVVDRLRNLSDAQRRDVYSRRFAGPVGGRIAEYAGDYRIALFTYLYQRRSVE